MKIDNYKRINTLIIVLLIAVTIISGCKKSSDESEQNAKAVLDQVLSCSLEEAGDFDALYAEMTEAETGHEPGISSINENEMKDYFQQQFGDSITDECLEQMMKNRTCTLSMSLAKQYSSDIAAEEIQLERRSGEQVVFDFTARLMAVTDKEEAAYITGNITMIYDESAWKASGLTVKAEDSVK